MPRCLWAEKSCDGQQDASRWQRSAEMESCIIGFSAIAPGREQGAWSFPKVAGDPIPRMCRFSDAGDDEASDRLEDRRLKSAEAGNRGKWRHRRCRGLYGDLATASGWARLVRAPAQLLCLAGWVWVTGRTSAAGVAGQGWRCHCGRIYRPAVSGGYAGRASQVGERHWAGGSGVRAL